MIILFLIGAFGLGRLTVNSLHLTWHRFEAWALIILFGYFFGAWALLIDCSLFGFQIGADITVTFMLGCWILPQTRHPLSLFSLTTSRQTGVWLITTGMLSLIIVTLLYLQMLLPGPGGVYSIERDLPLHLSIMNSVAYATRFTWHFSLKAGTYITYPFLIDFLSGMIVRWGGSLRFSLLLTSIPLCLALVQILFFWAFRAFENVRAAAFFTTIFLLNGSSGGFLSAISDFLQSKSNLWAFFSSLPQDYSDNGFYHFGNFISNMLMPQRGFQFGVSIFCAVMLLIYQLRTAMDVAQRRRILLLIGILTGLLPLAHVHSFFMSFTVLMIFALFDRKTASFREWLVSVVTSLLIALPQLVYQLRSNHHASFVHFRPGWTFKDSDFPHFSHDVGLLLFILAHFGFILALVIFSYRSLRGYEPVYRLILLGAGLFIAAFLYTFQPVAYDNIKFFIYAYLFFCLGAAQYLAQLSRSAKWQWAPLTLLLIASGTLSIVWKGRQHPILYFNRAFTEAREFRQQLPRDALVLTSWDHDNSIWSLAGQPVVEGDLDYLWSYGMPIGQAKRDVQTMYAGGDDALPLLRKYQVQYVVISRYERRVLPVLNESFFVRYFPLIYQRDGVSIYQVRRAS